MNQDSFGSFAPTSVNVSDHRLALFSLTADQFARLARIAVQANPHSKIDSIKFLRNLVNIGLKEAKDMVESVSAPPADPVLATARAILGV